MEADTLRTLFSEHFPGSGQPFLVRSPGRVNLIGEHMDYNGLPVLPMAIEQAILVAFCPRADGQIRMRNVDPRYPEVTFENARDLPRSAQGAWDNYCKAAVQKLNTVLEPATLPGMDMLFTSTLPVAAGLSSSSALVVACALCYLAALDQTLGEDISRLELAEHMATAEHYVGTRGGGMDQTVILNAMAGHACKIDFFPVRVENAPLPEGMSIVVCDSMVKVEKSGEALIRFNRGPRFCALGSALVEAHIQQAMDPDIELERLGDLWLGPLCLTFREGAALIDQAIPEERLGLDLVASRLGLEPAAVREQFLGEVPEPPEGFPLRARLRHQYTEYQRVEMARDALLDGNADLFGELMNASHQSCAEDFGISSPELDALVVAARESGALGSRLTGAGFGGATVSLVPKDEVPSFIEGVTRHYYASRLSPGQQAPIFVAHASDPAGYL
ncbi:MAG: N-acetylgalactosamine kinase [Candidatus Hydrogenedentota bacterium]